ncbi:MAG: DUF2286 domain-containing protein [Pyrobaculum sp.]
MSVIAVISKNEVIKKEVVEKEVVEVVKKMAIELIKSWNPLSSDFIVLRDFYSLSYPAPLSRELLEKIRKFSPRRVENKVEVSLPIYEIVYDAQWAGGGLQIGDATVIFPYIDEKTTEEILRGVIENLAVVEKSE